MLANTCQNVVRGDPPTFLELVTGDLFVVTSTGANLAVEQVMATMQLELVTGDLFVVTSTGANLATEQVS